MKENKNHAEQAEEVAAEAQNASSEKNEEATAAAVEQGVNYKEQFLRVTADFNNYQRRITKERSQWMQSAQVSVIESFLPLIDDVERALAATKGKELGEAGSAVAEGVALMAKNVQKVLADLGVTEIACAGEFDPALHEALMQTQSDEHESGQIVAVLSKGYQYKETVVRHAKVSVAA